MLYASFYRAMSNIVAIICKRWSFYQRLVASSCPVAKTEARADIFNSRILPTILINQDETESYSNEVVGHKGKVENQRITFFTAIIHSPVWAKIISVISYKIIINYRAND